MRDNSTIEIEEVPPTSPGAEYCLSCYYEEIAGRFDTGFDPKKSLAPTLHDFAPPAGTFIVIRLDGTLVGCGGFKRETRDTAYVKRMWVSRDTRGLGLGRRLLAELEARALSLGYRKICLETEKSLKEAQQLYRSSGYVEVPRFNDEPYADHWFEKPLF